MLNYDFFKIQNIIKENIISNVNISDYFNNIVNNNIILKKFMSIDYDNKIIIEKHEEIKSIINNIDNTKKSNYIIKYNNKNYIYILTNNGFDLLNFFNTEYNSNDLIILSKEGIFSPFLNKIFENNGKINYTFLSLGYYNYDKMDFNNTNLQLFKNCINIGYNTNSDTKFPGISIGYPLFNNHYNIYSTLNNDFLLKEYEVIFNNFKNIFNKINNNFNILNILEYKNYIKKYDNKNYVSVQDFLFYLNSLYNLDITEINIIYQNNNYLLLDKNEIIYQRYLLNYKTEINKLFLNILDKLNQNKYSKINFLYNYYNLNKDKIIKEEKSVPNEEIKVGNKKIKLTSYLESLDKSIDDKLNFV